VNASASSPSVHSSVLKIAGDELESARARVTELESEVSSLKARLPSAEEGASNTGDVRADLESSRAKLVELSAAVESVTLENTNLQVELSSLKARLQEVMTIVFDLDDTLVCLWNKKDLPKYPISYNQGDESVSEDIMIRPGVKEVLKKVSTMISYWSILFMFYLFYS
jgi:predicted nuclease with TOPRIM domain